MNGYQQDLVVQQQLWTTNGEVFLPEQLRLTQGQKFTGAWGKNVTKLKNKNPSQIQDKGHLSIKRQYLAPGIDFSFFI